MNTPNDSHDYTQVATVSRSYSIRKQRSSYRYRVTIPSNVLEAIDVENGDDLGFWVRATEDGHLQLVYETDPSGCHILTSVSKHSSGELTIPSAVGASGNLQEENLSWDTYERDDNSKIICGTTSKELDNHTSGGSQFLGSRKLKHVQQDVDHDGQEWSQEHFQLYLPVEEAEKVGWLDGEMVGLLLITIDGDIGLKFTRREQEAPEKSRKKVQKTGDYQRDRLTYAPNGLVRSMKLMDQSLDLYATKAGSLLTTKARER